MAQLNYIVIGQYRMEPKFWDWIYLLSQKISIYRVKTGIYKL